MKRFVFYTSEGYTESPTREMVENLQILGFENGENEKEAFKSLIDNNQWILERGFNQNKIITMQLAF